MALLYSTDYGIVFFQSIEGNRSIRSEEKSVTQLFFPKDI